MRKLREQRLVESRDLALAERKRAFPRALRLPGPLAVGPLRAVIDDATRA